MMWRVRVVFTGPQGSPWLATHYMSTLSGTAQTAAEAVGTFWGAADAIMSNQTLWSTEPDLTLIDETTGLATGVEQAPVQSGVGGLAGDMLPATVQALVRWRTGTFIGGRELRGRTFIPGISEGQTTSDGRLVATAQTILTNAAIAFIDAPLANLVVYSPTKHTLALVATGTAWPLFAVQRSRRD